MTLSIVAAWDQLPRERGYLRVATLVVVVCLTPAVVYRLWRWRQRRSSPAAGVSAIAVSALWLWLLLHGWWEGLPPVAKAVEITGGPGVVWASVLQVFMLRLRGVSGPRLRRTVWFIAAAALCVLSVMTAAVVIWDAASVDLDVYRFNAAPNFTNPGLVIAAVTGAMYSFAVLVQMVWLGVRYADNTPTGWGLGLLGAAAAACLVPVVRGGIMHHLGIAVVRDSMWLSTVPATLCAALLIAGFAAPPLMMYAQARRKLAQLKPIRDFLVGALPSLDAPLAPGASRTDVVHEWCSQIQDGLTLTAQQRGTPQQGIQPQLALSERAEAVARWLAGVAEPNLNCQWLTTPETVTSQDWTLAIAAAYQRYRASADLAGAH
ncbi:hypothetical protein ABQE45_18080 [Mycobacteroides chelonae]